MKNTQFWNQFKEVNELLKKQAFIQMPGGQDPNAGGGMPPGGDPSMGGAPMDPSMMGGGMPPPGMDPSMAGGAPMDPSMMGGAGGGMPPGGDPSMGGAPMDPSMMGGLPPGMGVPPPGMGDPTAAPAAGGEQPPPGQGSPMITISLDQLFEIIQKVLGLAKKVGANGSGVQQPQSSPQPQPDQNADQIKGMIYEALANMGGMGGAQ